MLILYKKELKLPLMSLMCSVFVLNLDSEIVLTFKNVPTFRKSFKARQHVRIAQEPLIP